MTFLDGCLATGILAALVLNWTLRWAWSDPSAGLLVGGLAARESARAWGKAGCHASPMAG